MQLGEFGCTLLTCSVSYYQDRQRRCRVKRVNLGWLLLGVLVSNSAWAEMQLNLTKGATAISREVYDLHMLIFYICTIIGIIVFGAMFWSMVFHRKSKGVKAADFHESTTVEILWTAIPIVILIAMAIPATSTLIAMENNDDAEVTIQITGSQWKWHYKYFDQDIEYYSVLSTPREQYENQHGGSVAKGEHYLLEVDKPLVIPVNKKVRFLITSDDVIHSWWVPAFAVKQDANPGFINEAWTNISEPGVYRGQCAELCGKDHGFMPIVVDVRSEADYAKWLTEQQDQLAQAALAEQQSLSAAASMDELMALGESTYMAHCAACHQPTGLGLPPAFPALKGSPIATGDVNEHILIVFNGRSGTGMQGYGKQLSLKEIAAVVTYERNAWGNNTGDAVQAADVKAVTSGGTATALPTSTETPMVEVEATVSGLAVQLQEHSEAALAEIMVGAEQVYLQNCVDCEQVSGIGLPSVFPALVGSAIAKGDISGPLDIAANQTDFEIAAVVTYERNAWGNDTGDLIQAADVAALAK